nr:hypothetical protein Iba_chr07fCG0200 [Ipomoea batatas]
MCPVSSRIQVTAWEALSSIFGFYLGRDREIRCTLQEGSSKWNAIAMSLFSTRIVEERETWKFWLAAVNKDAYQYKLLHVGRAFNGYFWRKQKTLYIICFVLEI